MQTDPVATPDVGAGTRWSIMVVSLLATASSFLFINGVAFLIPSLQGARGIRLDEAGLLASMPSWGMVVTLVAWGYVLDRVGERVVMTTGSALTALAAYAASSAHSMVLIAAYLFLGGMAAASCNTAGGRLVSAWFPRTSAGWRWASAKPRNRWESRWAPWSFPSWPNTVRRRDCALPRWHACSARSPA